MANFQEGKKYRTKSGYIATITRVYDENSRVSPIYGYVSDDKGTVLFPRMAWEINGNYDFQNRPFHLDLLPEGEEYDYENNFEKDLELWYQEQDKIADMLEWGIFWFVKEFVLFIKGKLFFQTKKEMETDDHSLTIDVMAVILTFLFMCFYVLGLINLSLWCLLIAPVLCVFWILRRSIFNKIKRIFNERK